jgi:hypothetical protein
MENFDRLYSLVYELVELRTTVRYVTVTNRHVDPDSGRNFKLQVNGQLQLVQLQLAQLEDSGSSP